MKLKQSVSESCWIESSLQSTEKKEQSIFLMLPDNAKDVEKVEAITKVTNTLVQLGWVIADVSEINHTTSIEYTMKCDATELVGDMLRLSVL